MSSTNVLCSPVCAKIQESPLPHSQAVSTLLHPNASTTSRRSASAIISLLTCRTLLSAKNYSKKTLRVSSWPTFSEQQNQPKALPRKWLLNDLATRSPPPATAPPQHAVRVVPVVSRSVDQRIQQLLQDAQAQLAAVAHVSAPGAASAHPTHVVSAPRGLSRAESVNA